MERRQYLYILLSIFLGTILASEGAAAADCACRQQIRARAADCLRNANASLFVNPSDSDAVKRAKEQERASKTANCEGIAASESSCNGQKGC
jgi:hypothetical protein